MEKKIYFDANKIESGKDMYKKGLLKGLKQCLSFKEFKDFLRPRRKLIISELFYKLISKKEAYYSFKNGTIKFTVVNNFNNPEFREYFTSKINSHKYESAFNKNFDYIKKAINKQESMEM